MHAWKITQILGKNEKEVLLFFLILMRVLHVTQLQMGQFLYEVEFFFFYKHKLYQGIHEILIFHNLKKLLIRIQCWFDPIV